MYDAIVIGARCAGAPTAMLLARKGYRVLLADKSTFPSDQVLSTHLIWQPGVAYLHRWGLLDELAASGCPPLTEGYFHFGPVILTGSFPAADGVAEGYAPRRILLDQLLVDAAVAAGVELREACSLRGLITERDADGGGERVIGIRARSRAGGEFAEKAAIVIGADGLHSSVARAVRPAEYATRPPLQGTYFTYWSDVGVEGIELYPRDYRCVYAWTTNDDLALIGVNWTARDFAAARADIEPNYLAVLGDAAPGLAERVQGGKREARWIGGAVPNFVRKPYGPGWALVGDAGYHKDPCTAQGITDAFRDAELLADAVDAALSERRPWAGALADYEHRRNDAAMPMYEFTCELAPFEPPTAEMQQLLGALHGNQAQAERFLGVFAGTVPVAEFFAPESLAAIAGSAPDGNAPGVKTAGPA